MKLSILTLALLALGSPLTTFAASQTAATATSQPTELAAAPETGPADPALPAWRVGLLERAFEAVSKMPLNPHIKNRSRAQEDVVEAALELGLYMRAERYANSIANWRKAAALADVGHGLIEAGYLRAGRERMAAAEVALGEVAKTEPQGWRIGRVRAKLAACHLALGELQEALDLQLDMPDSETAIVESAKAQGLSPEAFDAQLERAHAMVRGANFEQLKAVLATCTTLYGRFFEDPVRRANVMALIQDAWKALPVGLRIETSFELARTALAHGDRPVAIGLVDAVDQLRQAGNWSAELAVTMGADFARMRAELSQSQKARDEADAASALYGESRKRITDVFRGRCLRPLGAAYHAMGLDDEAQAVYALALEDGFENPNGRPRAEDLAATCLSMARADLEPTDELWARMGEISDALRKPW